MKCEKYFKYISQYIDDELNFFKRYFLNKHLKRCNYCRKELESVLQLKKLMKLSKEGTINDNIWLRLENRLVKFSKPEVENGITKFLYPVLLVSIILIISIFLYLFQLIQSGNLNFLQDIISLKWKEYILLGIGIIFLVQFLLGVNFITIFTLVRNKK